MQPVSTTNGQAPYARRGLLPAPSGSAGLDPYAEIEKVPLQTRDGMRSRGYTVRLEDHRNDSGWREVGVVSEGYLLIPNRDVRDLASEIAMRAGGIWSLSKEFFDGRRYVYASSSVTGASKTSRSAIQSGSGSCSRTPTTDLAGSRPRCS